MVFGRVAARVGQQPDALDFDEGGDALGGTETVADRELSVASVVNVTRRLTVFAQS